MREKIKDKGRLEHLYYKIRPKQLWNTIENDIPKLKPYIESYLKEQ